jgi:hypothetical protein
MILFVGSLPLYFMSRERRLGIGSDRLLTPTVGGLKAHSPAGEGD